jgi:hypothetical protein
MTIGKSDIKSRTEEVTERCAALVESEEEEEEEEERV